MNTILVTGGNGQLANCIRDVGSDCSNLEFVFKDLPEFDITNKEYTSSFFSENKIDWCINCAAYTAVDKAEIEKKKAYEVNVLGSKNIALACKENNVSLIHISTDFVFDGNSSKPYSEKDKANPIGVYGVTKLEGEQEIISILKNHYIVRTSWLYSEYGHNFLKSMLDFSRTRSNINVVDDQIGTPTYAKDLALVIHKIIDDENNNFGIYNYSNEGVASWYDFAKAIFDIKEIPIRINPIKSNEFPSLAKRPKFSVLDKSKIKQAFDLEIPYWRDSLKTVISKCNE